jgi:hypothetical protein
MSDVGRGASWGCGITFGIIVAIALVLIVGMVLIFGGCAGCVALIDRAGQRTMPAKTTASPRPS